MPSVDDNISEWGNPEVWQRWDLVDGEYSDCITVFSKNKKMILLE